MNKSSLGSTKNTKKKGIQIMNYNLRTGGGGGIEGTFTQLNLAVSVQCEALI